MTISEEENGAELYSQPLVFQNQNSNLYFRIKREHFIITNESTVSTRVQGRFVVGFNFELTRFGMDGQKNVAGRGQNVKRMKWLRY